MIEFNFNDKAQAAVDAANEQAGSMIKEITAETEANIRRLIAQAIAQGKPPYQAAQEIYDLIGLTTAQGQAVQNYRQQLVTSGLAPDKVDEKVADYADDLLTLRAETIARSEIMDALNAGQQAAWEQAQDEGILSADATKQWIITENDTCDECQDMEGEEVPVADEFKGGDPPLHPNCRCTIGIGHA